MNLSENDQQKILEYIERHVPKGAVIAVVVTTEDHTLSFNNLPKNDDKR